MKLLSKWWKLHSAMLISLSLVLAGCGGAGGGGVDSGTKGSGSTAGDNSIPDNTGTAGNGSSNGTGGTVADNTNTDVLPTDNTGKTTIFVDTNNAIDDLSLLNAGGVPTFGKKSKGKSLRGKAADINNIWAIQYTESGEIESIFPTTKSGTKYSFSTDLSDQRGYKFVFLGYENERWTGDGDEIYVGPTEETTTIGVAGNLNELNGFTDAAGGTAFLRTSNTSATKALISLVGDVTGGITITAKKAGDEGNSFKVQTKETTRSTYFVGIMQNGLSGAGFVAASPRIRYRTVTGKKGNVSIKYQYHPEFVPAKSQPSTVRLTGIDDVNNEDFDMWEYSEYDTASNAITLHYGPNTRLFTLALLLQEKNKGIINFADTTATPFTVDLPAAQTAAVNPTVALLNSNNGNLVASGNTDDEEAHIEYVPGTSTFEIYQKTIELAANTTAFYAAKSLATTAGRPATNPQVVGTVTSTNADLMKAFADASSNVRDKVDFTLVGLATTVTTSTHAVAVSLSGGATASGASAVQNFDKSTNPNFVWKDAINLFEPESNFSGGTSTLGLRSGTQISPKNPVGFDNLYKNFTYFGILHLKASDIASGKKDKQTDVEAKIVSAQSYRVEGNIGPAVTSIGNDSFTLGAPTGEIILHIRNYFHSDISLDDLRITASIKGANLDSDSGRVSVALPVPAAAWTLASMAADLGVVNDAGLVLKHAQPLMVAGNTLVTFKNPSDTAIVTHVFPAITSPSNTALFASGDILKQNYTITKKSRTSFIRNFQWETELNNVAVLVPSQAANTDTVIYDQDSDFTTASGGRDFRSSFISRSQTLPALSTNIGTYVANTGGEFLDLDYHMYYRPRSSVGTDTVLVFIEDGTQDPTGNLAGPRDATIVSPTPAGKIAESRSPSVGLDGTIIPYSGSDKDLIYNTLSLEIPVDTVVVSSDSVLEEPDALVGFSIVFDAVANSGSTAGQSETDPSTMTCTADLINERAGETYTYRWNWSRYFDLAGDNAFIGMPAGATLRGAGSHQVTFSDATGLHPEFTSVKVTIRASQGLDPEGTLRPFDPSTFNPSLPLVENVDRDYVFLDNYDSSSDVLDLSAGSFKAAVKLDVTTDPTQAHLIVTPKTNSVGEIIASGSEIAEAIRYYLINSPKMINLLTANSSFKLLDVYAKGSTTDTTPYWTTTRTIDLNGQLLGNARTADDNAGSSIDLKFANSDDYLNVRDAGSPVLKVTILDTVPSHNGSTFIVDLSNAYPPVLEASTATLSDVLYSFVSLSTDGITASSKKSKTNNEQFVSVANDTDADGAITMNVRVKRTSVGGNDTQVMQEKTVLVNGAALGAPSTRENQFVAYWDVKRVSDPSTQRLLDVGNSNLNDWVLAKKVDFVGSGADGNTDSIVYQMVYRAAYTAALTGATPDIPSFADLRASTLASAALNGSTRANLTALNTQMGLLAGAGVTGGTAANLAAIAAMEVARGTVATRVSAAAFGATVVASPTTSNPNFTVAYPAATALATVVAAGGGLQTIVNSPSGARSAVYNAIFDDLAITTPLVATPASGTNINLAAARVAKAAADAVDNGIIDEAGVKDQLATYTAVYNAIYAAALTDTDTVQEAKDQATVGATAAAAGATPAQVNLIVTAQAALASVPASGILSNTAGGTAATARNAVVLGKLNSATSTSISSITNLNAPTVALGTLALLQVQNTAKNTALTVTAGTRILNAYPVTAAPVGAKAAVWNFVYTGMSTVVGPTVTYGGVASVKVANASCSTTWGLMAEDYTNLIPADAQKFNIAIKGNSGQHDAKLNVDPDDPTNDELRHMLFSCRLILPTAVSARDSYFLNFRFRPGSTPSVAVPPIMTNSFIITVTQ